MRIHEILMFLDKKGIEYSFRGNENLVVEGFSSLNRYKPESFTWIKNDESLTDRDLVGSILLAFVKKDILELKNVIVTNTPKTAFFSTVEYFAPKEVISDKFIGKHTFVGKNVIIGSNVRIGNNCTIDGNVVIGDNTVVWNNVSITGRVTIGARCDIQSGCVIGFSNVAYDEDENHNKTIIKQFGGVTIGDDVYIQPMVKIGRGAIDDTIIEDKVVIGSGSSISHNCHIEENVSILPMGILCGSVHIGKNTYISSALIKEHVNIGKNAFVGLGSVVAKDVDDNESVWGFPARRFQIER